MGSLFSQFQLGFEWGTSERIAQSADRTQSVLRRRLRLGRVDTRFSRFSVEKWRGLTCALLLQQPPYIGQSVGLFFWRTKVERFLLLSAQSESWFASVRVFIVDLLCLKLSGSQSQQGLTSLLLPPPYSSLTKDIPMVRKSWLVQLKRVVMHRCLACPGDQSLSGCSLVSTMTLSSETR